MWRKPDLGTPGNDIFWLRHGRRGDISIATLPSLSSADIAAKSSKLRPVDVYPGMGVFIRDGRWGMTKHFGPCSAAIISGLNPYVWLGHLQPGMGIPTNSMADIKRNVSHSQGLSVTLIGGSSLNGGAMGAYHDRQIQAIQHQFASESLFVNIETNWNPVPDSWMVAFVQSHQGLAEVQIGYEK